MARWRARNTPGLGLVFRRAYRWAGKSYLPGTPAPEEMPERLKRKLFNRDYLRVRRIPDSVSAPRRAPTLDERIEAAIGALDPEESSLWSRTGVPRVDAIERVLGEDISAAQRNAAWAEYVRKHQ